MGTRLLLLYVFTAYSKNGEVMDTGTLVSNTFQHLLLKNITRCLKNIEKC